MTDFAFSSTVQPNIQSYTQNLPGTQTHLSPSNTSVATLPVNEAVMQELNQAGQLQHSLVSEFTQEEYQSVMEKLKQFVKLPAGHLPKQDELYLEQQLSDMFGFEVTAELEGKRLNHSLGVMSGLPHLRRYPADVLKHHDSYREAGLASTRGNFGWFTEMGQLTPAAIAREKYYFAVQATFLANWSSNYETLREWFKFRKMIVLNPEEERAVIGAVGDIGPADWMQHQFGGSPEVIREGLIWSYKSRGRVLLLFVNDLDNTIPLGTVHLGFNQK